MFNSPEARDISYVLHPNTDARKHLACGPQIIVGGEGVHVFDNQGRKYIEAMSGLWSVAVGFGNKRLADVAQRQMEKLCYYHGFFHKSTEPMIDLAEKLVTMAPGNMSKAFFTNSGSEANDTLLKFLWYRSNAMGQPERKKIITRRSAYHGVTIATSSLTGLAINHTSFDLIVPDVIRISCPDKRRIGLPGEGDKAFSARMAEELEQEILAAGPETICAFLAEPVMCAAGVIVPPEGYWARIQEVLNRYGILLVLDEVICGFGRTGKMFGAETYGITPDAVVVSKQLSSSYLPISAVLLNDRILAPIIEESGRIGALAHGFTGGGHPVCAAVALENLRIIEEEGLVENAARMGDLLRAEFAKLRGHPLVGETRGVGLLAAVELTADNLEPQVGEDKQPLGALLAAKLSDRGVLARACGDAVTFCPPMIITAEEIRTISAAVRGAVDDVWQMLAAREDEGVR